MSVGFVCWIQGEGQPALPAETSSWMLAGRSGTQWGAGGLQRREEGDADLLSCSAARSQIPGGTCQLPVFSTVPTPWGLWVSSVDTFLRI